MHRSAVVAVCRTTVVLLYLVVLALAGTGGWASLAPALTLVAVWAAPYHGRRAADGVADAPAG